MSAYVPSLEKEDLIIGHGDFKYKVEKGWGQPRAKYKGLRRKARLSPKHPVNDCHEMVQDAKGRILLLTNHLDNNVLIFDQNGKLLDSWGNVYPGAHGLTLKNEGGTDYLYITDTELHEVVKTTLDGKVVLRIENPRLKDAQGNDRPFLPTETAIAENGDIYVADGYGSQYIHVYNQKGELKSEFGGRGDADHQFYNAHGVAIDSRNGKPKVLVTAREKNQLKYFNLEGKYLSTIQLPGAYICRPVIHGDNVFLATIWSGEDKANNSGFISILDKNNRMVSAPGGSSPRYADGLLNPMHQTLALFKHPHDVCVDRDENLYIPQWNAGQVYPIKLHRV